MPRLPRMPALPWRLARCCTRSRDRAAARRHRRWSADRVESQCRIVQHSEQTTDGDGWCLARDSSERRRQTSLTSTAVLAPYNPDMGFDDYKVVLYRQDAGAW